MNALLLMIALLGDGRVASNLEDRELRSSNLPVSGQILADGTQPDGGKKKKKKKNGEESEEDRA